MDKRQEMIHMCKELRLPSIRAFIQEEAMWKNHKTAEDFLYHALMQEMQDREVRAKSNRIRLANFPEKKLLTELEIERLPQNAASRLPQLKTLDFIKEKQNVLLIELIS
ncbi:ATP-binding protein [Ureibacillus sp. FSL W8-0352]|uniref:ATP-binding protein n=1 Tax=Ureibacillus sp. FSL W8-0352 TaxID=2954596 RepID=UPI0030F65B95